MRSLLICKPNSVYLKKDRACSGRSSFIWDCRHRQPQAVYPHRSGGALLSPEGERCCLTLHPTRFTCPTLSPTLPAGSYPRPFTHHLCPEGSSAGLLSVALAVTARGAFLLGSMVPCGVRTFLTRQLAGAMIRSVLY